MPEVTEPVVAFMAAQEYLKYAGIRLIIAPGEFCVFPHGDFCKAVYADDLAEAVELGLIMGEGLAEKLPPLGPMGSGSGKRKGLIFRHNRSLAAIRRLLSGRAE